VARFLSDVWLDEFDAALRADSTLGEAFGASPITIAQEVVDDAGGRGYLVVLDAAGGRIATDGSLADVTFISDRDTAGALARGELNAQRALTSGRLKVRGDVDRLGAAGAALSALGDVLAAVRAHTEY
jgi:putative sterol carrier protein